MANYKNEAEKAKDALIAFLSHTKIGKFSSYEAEDIVEETLTVCREVIRKERGDYSDIGEVISDYLDLGGSYVGIIMTML